MTRNSLKSSLFILTFSTLGLSFFSFRRVFSATFMALLASSLQLFYYRWFQFKVCRCITINRFLTIYPIQSWLIDLNYFYFWHHQLVWVNDLSSFGEKQPSARTSGLERWVKLYRRCKSSRCTRGRKRWQHWSISVAGSDLDFWYFKWQVAMCVYCSNHLNLFLWNLKGRKFRWFGKPLITEP